MNHGMLQDYSFEMLTARNSDETAVMLSGEFVTDEPMYRALGINPAEYLPLARLFIPFCADEGLSFIIRHRETGECAGFILAADFVHEPHGSLKDLCKASDEFWDAVMHERVFLQQLEASCLERRKPGKGEILHLTALGVRRVHQGKGLASALVQRAIFHGMDRGFVRAVSECTGPVSLKVHQKCGFITAGSLEYGTFKRQGGHPFASLQGACVLVEKELDNAAAWCEKGHFHAALRENRDSFQSYDRVIRMDPRHVEALNGKGSLLAGLGFYEEALGCFEKALAADPGSALIWDRKGSTLHMMGRFDEALECCDRVIAIDPGFFSVWHNRGLCLQALGRDEEAQESFAEARRLVPGSADTML